MRIGCSRERNSFGERECDDLIRRIKFVDRFPPARGRKFNREVARSNQIEGFADDRLNLPVRSMSVNLDKVQVRKAVDQAAAGDLANAAKIISVHFIDVSTDKLFSACRNSVE